MASAFRSERPVYATLGKERVVLLPFELEHGDADGHRVAAAAAPRMTLRRSIGAFALIYLLVATFSAVLATIVLFRIVRRAFAPIDEAREQADRVVSLGEGKRLTESGPTEIRTLLVAINRLLDRLDMAHDAQSRFTAEAAHELRTPVTAMLGELDVAMRSERSADEYRQTLESVREEVSRLRQLVEALTALARIDAGQIDRGRELVRAAEIATNAVAAGARLMETTGNDVRVEVDDDPELEVHRVLVEVALGNLLRNAARHAPDTEVILTVSQSDGRVEYTIDDAGPGIPPSEREALFDRFVRSGTARREDRSGMGLGLPIAREIARRHGGDCTLDESPSGGVRARLTLRASDS